MYYQLGLSDFIIQYPNVRPTPAAVNQKKAWKKRKSSGVQRERK